jgi:outer membrane protein assembly factor BamB
MTAIPLSALADRLQSLPQDDLVAFVADLCAASGWETSVEGPVVVATEGGSTRQLLVLQATRVPRLRSAPETTGPVDLVVTPRVSPATSALPRGTPDVPVVSAEDLRNRLLYAVDADVGDKLARDHFGVPARSDDWTPAEPALLRAARTFHGVDDPDEAPVSRRAALGIVGASLAAGSAWLLARSRTDPDGTDSGIDDDPGISNESVPETAAFAFEHTDDGVRVVHDGGDPVVAGQLLIHSSGLGVPPEVAWSDIDTVSAEEVVTEGDSLVLPAADAFELTILIDRDEANERLGEFSRGEFEGDGDTGQIEFRKPPLADFTFSYDADAGKLVVTHDGGDPIRAAELLVRGSGFLRGPEYRWSEHKNYHPGNPITPDTVSTLFNVGDDVVARVVWDDGSRAAPRTLATFLGPERPLDPSLGGVQSDRYGPNNAGYATEAHLPGGLREAWRLERPLSFGQTVALGDGKAVVANGDGAVFGIDATDGVVLWRTNLSGAISATPTVAEGRVFVRQFGQGRISLRTLDLTDGSVQWSIEFPNRRLGRPIVREGTVILPATGGGGGRGIIYATSADTGRSKWARNLDAFVVPMSAAASEEAVYAAPSTGVVALDRESDTPQWRFEPDDPFGEFWWPMVAGELLVVCQLGPDGDRVTALDREDGTERWHASVPAGVGTFPAVGDRSVYVGLAEGGLRVFDRGDGNERWRSGVGDTVQAITASVDALYVADHGGTLHALSPEDGSSLLTVETGVDRIRSLVALEDSVYLSGDNIMAYRLE